MKTLSVKISLHLDAALDRLAAARHRTKSSLVRDAIAAAVETGEKANGKSCAAQAADLKGCFEGPRDLSTHKRHMRGYGQ
jgi:predicted transcriptional regulator